MTVAPSHQGGFATYDESAHPEMWSDKAGAWSPLLGPSGLTLQDFGRLSRNGTLTNLTPSTCWDTQNGYPCLKFVGGSSPSSHVACGNAPLDITTYTQPFTMQAWIKVNAWRGAGGSETFFISSIGTSDYLSASFQLWQKKISFSGDSTGTVTWEIGAATPIGGTVLSLATLYHIAITRSTAGVYTAWLNGKSDGTATLAANLVVNSQTMRLGAHYALNTTYDTDGWIFDFQFDARAWTADEMLYAAQRPGIMYEPRPRRRRAAVTAAATLRNNLMLLGVS